MKKILFLFSLTIFINGVSFSQNDCDLCEQWKKNVVKISAKFSDGSDESGFGIIVGESGDKLNVATAAHVVYKFRNNFKDPDTKTEQVKIKFFTEQGIDYDATLLNLPSNRFDLTLIQIPKPAGFSWTKDFYSTAIKRGTTVWFIGRDGRWYVPIGPAVGAIDEISYDDEISISINSISPGTSGAPLISEKGVVGIIFEDAASGAKAYPIEKVKQIISDWNYPWQLNLNPDNSIGAIKTDTNISKNQPDIAQENTTATTFEMGDKYDDGIIFYIDETGKSGLIASEKDLGDFDWDTAKQKCASLGKGWHLPSVDELKKLYSVKERVGGFSENYYWTSGEFADKSIGTFINFKNGENSGGVFGYGKSNLTPVRAVRPFPIDETTPTNLKVGDNYGGGIIFFLDESKQHGLIAAPTDQSTSAPWGCKGIELPMSTEETTGKKLTKEILEGCSQEGIAARICSELRLGGYNDWYLPSYDELMLMWNKKDILGHFGAEIYWASNQWLDKYVGCSIIIWESGTGTVNDRSGAFGVRAIRSF